MSWFKRRHALSPLQPVPPNPWFCLFLGVVCFFLGFGACYFFYGARSTHLSPRTMQEVDRATHHIDDLLDHAMSLHIQALEEDNQRLRDSLAIYTVLEKAHIAGHTNVHIGYLSAKRLSPSLYEYHVLLTRDGTIDRNKDRDLPPVHLSFEATVPKGHHLVPVPIVLNPQEVDQPLHFQYFHKLDGQFTVRGVTEPIKSLTIFVYIGQRIVATQTFSFY